MGAVGALVKDVAGEEDILFVGLNLAPILECGGCDGVFICHLTWLRVDEHSPTSYVPAHERDGGRRTRRRVVEVDCCLE